MPASSKIAATSGSGIPTTTAISPSRCAHACSGAPSPSASPATTANKVLLSDLGDQGFFGAGSAALDGGAALLYTIFLLPASQVPTTLPWASASFATIS